MKLRHFQKAFLSLQREGTSVWEQGFTPSPDCNINALIYFRDWLKTYADLFEDSKQALEELDSYIEAETNEES